MNVTSRFVDVCRARIHVIEAGSSGEPLVFLHAGVADGRMWARQQHAFAASRQTLAIDRRGFGRTTCEAEPFSHVDDLIAVLDAFGIERTVLVGCSMGGRLAIDTALAHPQRVRAVVLVAAAVSGAPQIEAFPAAIEAKFHALEAAEQADLLDEVNEIEAQLWLDGPEQAAGRVSSPLRNLFLAMNDIALRAAPVGSETQPAPAWPRLHTLALPTLVVWGTLDFPHLLERMRHIAATVPGAHSHVIANTAHLPSLERPEEFNAALARFLSSLDR